MKTVFVSGLASALLFGAGIASFAAPPAAPAPLVEGKGQPILLKRMIVSATPLP